MARARFIRPEFFTDEKVGELPFGARLLFAGIWCHCDLRGVFEHNPKRLRVLIFPFDEGTTSKQIGDWLDLLTKAGLVARFEADGKSWGHVRQWDKHQSISGSEAKWGSKLPPPPTNHPRNDTVTNSGTAQCHAQAATLTHTLTPTLTPTPTHAGAREPDQSCPMPEDETTTPSPAPVTRPAMDSDEWNYRVAAEPWAKAIRRAGGKIGRENWPRWDELVKKYAIASVVGALAGIIPSERWPDKAEEKLCVLGEQASSLGDTIAHKVKRVTL